MKFITVIALFAVSSAFASEYVSRKMNWSPRMYNGGTTTYYNCQSVESTVESHLKAMGAQSVRVSCSGGIEMGWNTPAMVSASFDVVVPGANDAAKQIVLKGNDSCSLNTEFLDLAIPMFPGVKIVSKRSSCMGSNFDRWTYTLSVTE
jgi:hypothetical protein